MSILIHGGVVITLDPEGRIYKDGAVLIEKDRIQAIGKSEQLKRDHRPEVSIDATDKIVIPGLINTHYHIDSSLFLGLATDTSLKEWTYAPYSMRCQMDEGEAKTAAMLSCVTNIKGGITSAVFNCNVLRKDRSRNFESMVQAVSESGMRAIIAKLFHTHASPVRSMPFSDQVTQSEDEVIREYETQMGRFHNMDGGRIRIWFGPNSPQTTSLETIVSVHRLAEKYGVGIHTHVGDDERFRQQHGMSPIKKLDSLGVLGPRFHAVHGYELSKEDIQIIAKTGAAVCHNPTSNIALACGIAPLREMVDAGAAVSLGTDGPHCLDRTDMFETMRVAAYLQKNRFLDGSVLGNAALTTFRIATLGGAKAMGQEGSIGTLEVGKKADLAVVETNVFNSPVLDPVANLVYLSSSGDVDTTVVDGKVLMQNKTLTFTDEKALMKQASEALESLLARTFKDRSEMPVHGYNFV